MRCILHIGIEKTGTTSLQVFLRKNRHRLRRAGYLVPQSPGRVGHTGLCVACYRGDRRDDLTAQWNVHSEADIERHRRGLVRLLAKEVAAARPRTVIFSAEHLQSRLTVDDEVQTLRTLVQAIGCDQIGIVVYLRRPAELVNSFCSTLFRNGHHMPAPPAPDHPYLRNLCDHRSTIERWARVFGHEAIRVRLYEKRRGPEGTGIESFLTTCGIDSEGLRRHQVVNQSLSAVAAEVLHRVNTRMANHSPDQPLVPAEAIIAAIDAVYGDGVRYAVPRDTWDLYDSEFAASDEWVRRHFFPDRHVLWGTSQSEGGVGNRCELPDERLERIAGRIVDLCRKRNWCRPWGEPERSARRRMSQRLADKARQMFRTSEFVSILRDEKSSAQELDRVRSGRGLL